MQQRIGFIGQGFIGKNSADDFVERGYEVVRYALEAEYAGNRAAIAGCDIVFVAVPTPTTPEGFDSSALEAVLPLVGEGSVAIIKSTILPGTTRRLQEQFPTITLMHAPEFLREKSAAQDTRVPLRNILGVAGDDAETRAKAEEVLQLLPQAPYQVICRAEEAELIKYGGNNFLALKVVYMNLLYDAAQAVGADYDVIAEAVAADPRIGNSHMQVVDSSGHPGAVPGRGAGGHCFPKDLAAFREWYAAMVSDASGQALIRAAEEKNREFLMQSGKDHDLLAGIYGSTA